MKSQRYIEKYCREDLQEKLVFIGGPRQVGKTTLALKILGSKQGIEHPAYLNWDVSLHRKKILNGEIAAQEKLFIFDEVHKYARWRNFIKGFYDQFFPNKTAIVTGSARLDYYRKGGDSLQGRYHYYRLHPYSLMELTSSPNKSDLELLLQFGGFPEPLAKQSLRHWRRWRAERLSRVFQGDIQDLEKVAEISLLELMLEALPERIGSPLSLENLRQDLQVSHDSVRRWLTIFDNMYISFRLSPYGAKNIRAVKKEQKLYLWDWSNITNDGARFENLVACNLLKYCHFMEDVQGYQMELKYLRDTAGREVDFIVLQDNQPLFAVECKLSSRELSPNCKYFSERLGVKDFYQVHAASDDYIDKKTGIRILPLTTFVKELGLP